MDDNLIQNSDFLEIDNDFVENIVSSKAIYRKQFEIMQDEEHLKVDIQKVCSEHSTIKQYAYIKHDKDDTRPHYHIYVNFGRASISHLDVAKWFNVPQNFVRTIKSKVSYLRYLTHDLDSQRHKHQYSPGEVISNFDFQTVIKNDLILGDFENYSYAQQLKYINTLPRDERIPAFNKLERFWKMHCQSLALQKERNVKVVFICGKAGSGKTYYAKKLCNSEGYDYCISSSSNDPFQDYMGEKVMIFDDLRYTAFPLSDLLKMLDNHTSSSYRCRFANKVFNGDMIIITSPIPVAYWYPEYKDNCYDSLEQLYRRISCYVVVSEREVCIYNKLDKDGNPVGLARVFQNELYFLKQDIEVVEKVDFCAMFAKFLPEVSFPATQQSFLKKGELK